MALFTPLILCASALLATTSPLPPPVTTESGNGIAPWAGKGPKPAPRPSPMKVLAAPQAAGSDAPPPASSGAAQASSSVPVGKVITGCTTPGAVALTFDDGPYIYTAQILDILKDEGVPATFFLNGDNWGNILSEDSQALVQRQLAEGHQIGSHTWSHPDLATLPHDEIVSQMTLVEDALVSITGKYPSYMRPPYLSTNELSLQTLGELGYHVISADIDTLDYNNDAEDLIQTSVQRFKDGVAAGGTIELSHDVHQWTANTLVQGMIDEIKARGLTPLTVGACLGDPEENWYRTR